MIQNDLDGERREREKKEKRIVLFPQQTMGSTVRSTRESKRRTNPGFLSSSHICQEKSHYLL
jgi:hypothetical protein